WYVREVLALEALAPRPAVIAAALHNVHLFPPVVAYVNEQDVRGDGMESELPRVPEAVGVDLRACAFLANERVVRRHSIGLAGVRSAQVQPQQLPPEGPQVLRGEGRLVQDPVRALAVADAHPQHPVGSEAHLAAVVERLWHEDAQQGHLALDRGRSRNIIEGVGRYDQSAGAAL